LLEFCGKAIAAIALLHESIDRSILGQAAVRASIAVAAVLVAAVLLVGCASKSLSTKNETMPPIVVATLSVQGLKICATLIEPPFAGSFRLARAGTLETVRQD